MGHLKNHKYWGGRPDCIVPESVNTIDLFDNAVGDHEIDDPDEIFFLNNFIDVLQRKKQRWWMTL